MSLEKQLETIEKSLAHIELLLQRMPEIMATVNLVEKEHADEATFMGKPYSSTITIVPPNER